MCLRNAVGVCAWYERMKDRETENEIEQEQKRVVKERWGHCLNLPFPHLTIYIFMCHTLWPITLSFDSYITWCGYIIYLWSQFTAECCSWQISHLFNWIILKYVYGMAVWRTLLPLPIIYMVYICTKWPSCLRSQSSLFSLSGKDWSK